MSHLSQNEGLYPSFYGLTSQALRSNRSRSALFLLTASLHAACHGVVAFCAGQLGKSLLTATFSTTAAPQIRPLHLALLGLTAVGIKGLSGTFASFLQAHIACQAAQSLRSLVVENLFAHGLESSSPHALALISSRTKEAERAIADGSFAALRAIAQLLPITIALLLVSHIMSALALCALAPFALILARARAYWRTLHRDSMQRADRLHVEIDDFVRHADLWRSHGSCSPVRNVIHRLGDEASHASTKAEAIRVALSSSNELLGALALLLAVLGAERFTRYADAADLIAFSAIFMAYRPIRDLGDARSAISRGQEALQSLRSLSHNATMIPVPQSCEPRLHQAGTLVVNNLQVPGRSPCVSFRLESGRTLALCGASGSGKTSILRALLGLERVMLGSVHFNDHELVAGAVGPTHRPFAWLPQDAPVLSGSLDDNFAIVGASASSARRELESFGAQPLLSLLADTQVGATGRTLSGGERRWLGLARVLATRCPILLLDEPTEGLDPKARQRLHELLRSLKGRRTMIIVTHHAETLELADQILRLDPSQDEAFAEKPKRLRKQAGIVDAI